MKTFSLRWMLVLVILALPGLSAAQRAPAAGDRLPDMRLDSPENPDTRAYLGLSPGDTFDPAAITGSLLVIEIFSMYCPVCQREAPAVNRLYQAIEASQTLRDRVKIIGIGVGNSAYEVDYFRKHYQVTFPLFADPDFLIHKTLGEVRTPFFIIATIGPNDKGRVLWTDAGNMEVQEIFMNRLKGFLSAD